MTETLKEIYWILQISKQVKKTQQESNIKWVSLV